MTDLIDTTEMYLRTILELEEEVAHPGEDRLLRRRRRTAVAPPRGRRRRRRRTAHPGQGPHLLGDQGHRDRHLDDDERGASSRRSTSLPRSFAEPSPQPLSRGERGLMKSCLHPFSHREKVPRRGG
mgnify:CR=1 FL=1